MTEPLVHIVEDDDALRDSLRFLLRVHRLPARAYASGGELLAALAKDEVAGCIVTDLRMPEMNGLELLQRLRDLGVTLPVIMMTGHGDRAMAREAKAAGAIDFFEKPFEEEPFVAAIRRALAAPPAPAPAPSGGEPPTPRRRGLLDRLAASRKMRRGT